MQQVKSKYEEQYFVRQNISRLFYQHLSNIKICKRERVNLEKKIVLQYFFTEDEVISYGVYGIVRSLKDISFIPEVEV